MRNLFGVDELQWIGLSEPFDFTKNCQMLKIPKKSTPWALADFDTLLFDLQEDAGQLNPIHDVDIENRMIEEMMTLMKQNDAPSEQYERLGLV